MIKRPKFSIQYQIFMMVVSIISLLTITSGLLISKKDGDLYELIQLIDVGICFIFLSDFIYSFIKAEKKLHYMKWGWIDLLASIPQIDVFRYGRLARVLRIFTVLRAIKSSKMLYTALAKNKRKSASYAMGLVGITSCLVSSALILKFESGLTESNIKNAHDALWWSYVTITTVGYGDFYPVSMEGRVIATILMTVGIGIFSGVSSVFVSLLIDKDGDGEIDTENSELKAELAEIKAILEKEKPWSDDKAA